MTEISGTQYEALWEGYSLAFRHLSGHEEAIVTRIDNGTPVDKNLTMFSVVGGEEISKTVSKLWFRDFVRKNSTEKL